MIVSKCDGLPLALVSLGSVLSSCGNIESEWKRVHDQLRCELESNKSLDRLKNVLQLSINYLPDWLKDCFLYCSMFPEDYLLARKKLIRLWVAEDFVKRSGGSTLEETAEGYLLELINRNLLQVVEKNDSGRVKRCRMHDTLRELAISLCMNNEFGLLYVDNMPIYIDQSVPRLSIINSDKNIGQHYVQLPQLRTLMSFDLSMHLSSLVTTDFVKCKHLTVLNLENLSIKSVPNNIGHLLNLRYLGLRNTKVKLLPKSISKLVKLQTLDLCKSEIIQMPEGIIQLIQLRHLFAETVIDDTYKSFQDRKGIYLPKGTFYLKELQTLQSVNSNDMVVGELGNLTQLRSLGIRNVNESHSAELCRSLSKMPFLYSLYIFANENQILHLNHLNSPSLRKLWLFGQLEYDTLKSPLFQISGEYIQQLYLGWSELSVDPLPMLPNLENLTSLFLNRAYSGNKLSFRARWFPRLKKLGLTNMPYLEQVKMKNGTMRSIETIVFQDMKSLRFPQGVEHLNSLKSILCDNLSPNFGVPIGVHKIQHFNCTVYE